MSIIKKSSRMRDKAAANGSRAQQAAQSSETNGLCALERATYILVSDENGRMDDDLFDLLLEEEARTH